MTPQEAEKLGVTVETAKHVMSVTHPTEGGTPEQIKRVWHLPGVYRTGGYDSTFYRRPLVGTRGTLHLTSQPRSL